MPPIRDHGMVYDEVGDDGELSCTTRVQPPPKPKPDMPPLVDNPNPSMTYTFHSDMTPVSFNPTSSERIAQAIPPSAAHDVSPESSTFASTPPQSPLTPTEGASIPHPRGSHGKKRDASYIPRPPNAFILFRSSFIRSQQVPGKVEGNHSTLSKIIGELPAHSLGSHH